MNSCYKLRIYHTPTDKLKIRTILLTKTTAAQNEVALTYRSVRGLYFLAVVVERSI